MQAKNTVPATAAIATVTLTAPGEEPIVAPIACEKFDCCELARRVAEQFPGRTIAATHWQR